MANYALTRTLVYDPAVLLTKLSAKALARIDEVTFQQADSMANWTVPLPECWALKEGSDLNYTAGQVGGWAHV